MKLFKSSILAMLAFSAVTMVSCDGGSDVGYVEGAQSNGAYFATTAPRYNLEDDATSFSIPIDRPSKDSPSTVNLVVDDPSGLLNIPNQVSFDGESLTTNVVITYDAEKFEYDKPETVTLTIENANIYGNGTYSFSVVRPSPWKTLGTGLYTDAIMCSLYNIEQLTYSVEIQESLTTPGLFRVKNPYGPKVFPYTTPDDMVSNDDYYMVINAVEPDKVYVEEFCTNMIWDPDLGVMSFQSMAAFYLSGDNPLDLIASAGHCGKYADGIITMPSDKSGFLFQGSTADYSGGWYGPLKKAGWRLLMPGVELTDYSAELSYQGRLTDVDENTFLLFDVTLGDDVEYAKAAASTSKDLAAIQQAIVNDEIESVEITESGSVRIPVSESGLYTVMVVTFAKGEAQEIATTTIEVAIGGSEWESIGDAAVLDGWMLSASSSYAEQYENMVWTCPIQRSTKRPGIYRLVQPYGPTSPMRNFAEPGIYNIEINAQDPTNVIIEPQSTGNGWFSDGIMTIASAGFRRELSADLRATFEDGVFWFPATTCIFSFDGDTFYYTRNPGAFQILDYAPATANSFKAIKNGITVGTAKQRMNGIPYNISHYLPRYNKFERVY